MNGPGYLAVTVQPGADTDVAAFHDWYNTEHGPLRLRLPFILTGDRYEAADGQQPCWCAVYDVSDLAKLQSRIYTRLREERSKREKEVMRTFASLDRKMYSLVSMRSVPSYSGPAPVQLTVSATFNESDIEAFDKWYDEEHAGLISKVPGWLRTRRLRTIVGGPDERPPARQVECFAVHDFAESNGINGPEHTAAQDTEWGSRVLNKAVSKGRRQWSHRLTFGPLEESASTLITTDGAELQFQVDGKPSDPVIVCINSILTNFHIWDDVTADLVKGLKGRTFRVVRYNTRGYLQQSPKSNDTRFDLLADDLEYMLSRLRIGKVHAVLGVSMGGVTSINFAIRHPDLLEKFVACDCNVAVSPANNQAWADRIELAKTNGMPELARVTAERWFTPPNHSSPNFAKVLDMIKPASIEGFAQSAGALSNYDLKDKLRDIRTPGLLLAGEADGKLPQAMQGFGIPDTTFKAIPNAGHLPMMENHGAFMNALAGFL